MKTVVQKVSSREQKPNGKQWVVACPHCQKFLFFSPEKEGQLVKCPTCGRHWHLEKPFLF